MKLSGLFLLLINLFSVISFLPNHASSRAALKRHHLSKLFQNKESVGNDAVSRRRKRRQRTETETVSPTQQQESQKESSRSLGDIDSSSLEDKFGLGNQQLRELLEQELPVPRENLATRKVINEKEVDKEKAFQLPDLNEFIKDISDSRTKAKDDTKRQESSSIEKIDRSNQEEYLRVIQLNPFADADDSMFLEEYDIFQSIFGTGKLMNIPIPYLQTGHGILLIIVALAAFIYAPGNPLTEFPPEIRAFFRNGLTVTYTINAVLAVVGFQRAQSKNLPGIFWAVKCFVLGGVAFYEISQAKDPKKMNERLDPSDRKSNSRR